MDINILLFRENPSWISVDGSKGRDSCLRHRDTYRPHTGAEGGDVSIDWQLLSDLGRVPAIGLRALGSIVD